MKKVAVLSGLVLVGGLCWVASSEAVEFAVVGAGRRAWAELGWR